MTFIINHISGSFVEMVLWWVKKRHERIAYRIRQLHAVIEPII